MDFSNATLMRSWQGAGFRIELHDSSRPPGPVHTWVGYRLIDDVWAARTRADAVIFTGDDLGVRGQAIDGLATVRVLGRFLSCEPGDVDPEYFRNYSPAQLAWRDARAADLAACCIEPELETSPQSRPVTGPTVRPRPRPAPRRGA